MAFWTSLGGEWVARRRRLRSALGDRLATPLEFLILGGLIFALFAAVERSEFLPLAPVPAVSAFVGYLILEWARQRASAGSALWDRAALATLLVPAAAGYALFVLAQIEPQGARIDVPEAPPPEARYVDVE